MSRRHNAARRRNYGRRQHEVRERRLGARQPAEWQNHMTVNELTVYDEFRVSELDERRPSDTGSDGYGGAQL